MRTSASFPISNWDRVRRLAVHRARSTRTAGDLLRASAADRSPSGRHAAGHRGDSGAAGRCRRNGAGALSHGRRHHLHGTGPSPTPIPSPRSLPRTATTTITERGATRLDDPDLGRLNGTTQERRVFSNVSQSKNFPTVDNGLLRFLTCGSGRRRQEHADRPPAVSTRRRSSADTLSAIERTSKKRGMDAIDLSLLTDGLQAEREQGITIDVAYRYFTTGTPRSTSSPTRRATSSTRATWSPPRRPRIWRSS